MSRRWLFWPTPAGGGGASPPTILDTTPALDSGTGDPRNVAYQLPSSSADRLIIAVYDDGSATVDGITWTATGASGQSLAERRVETNGQTSLEVWDLVNPNFGTDNGNGVIAVDRSSGIPIMGAVVYALDGAHTDAPIVNGQNGAAVTDPPALSIDPEPNSVILDFVVGGNDALSMTFDVSETETIDEASSGAVLRAGAAHKSVTSGDATSVNVSFSGSQPRYCQIAVAYKTA